MKQNEKEDYGSLSTFQEFKSQVAVRRGVFPCRAYFKGMRECGIAKKGENFQ